MYVAQGAPKRRRIDTPFVLEPGKAWLKVLIPQEATLKVIGERGATIAAIARSTNTHMNIGSDSWPGTASRVLTVQAKGAQGNVAGAAAEALRVSSADVIGEMQAVIIIPVVVAPLLVGKRGSRVNELQEATKTLISMRRMPPGATLEEEQEMLVQGPFDGVGSILQTVSEAIVTASGGPPPFQGMAASALGSAMRSENFRPDFRPKAQTLCRYFLEAGGCRAGDRCEFSHDPEIYNKDINNNVLSFEPPADFKLKPPTAAALAQPDWPPPARSHRPDMLPKSVTPCKYFLQPDLGGCRKGASCDFSHDLATALNALGVGGVNQESDASAAQADQFATEDWESLAGASASASQASAAPDAFAFSSTPEGLTSGGAELSDEELLASPCCAKLQLPTGMRIGSLIGKGGSLMKQLRQETGVTKLHVAEEAGGLWLEIAGSFCQVQSAMAMTVRRLSSMGVQMADGREEAVTVRRFGDRISS